MEVQGTEMTEEEGLPGFLRVQEPGKRVYYRTPFPRRVLFNARNVEKYLEQQHKDGQLLAVTTSMFTFARKKIAEESLTKPAEPSEVAAVKPSLTKKEFMVKQMIPDTKVKLDHRAELCKAATALDQEFVGTAPVGELDTEQKLERFCLLKESLGDENIGCKEMMGLLFRNQEMNQLLCTLTRDVCFEEIARISTKQGPLVAFPPSVNSNVFVDIVKFAMKEAPRTLEFHFGFVVKKGQAVRPSHVIKLAVLFANLCYATNHDLDALTKLRGLTLQLDNLSDKGLDLMASQELSHTARSLSDLRDTFSAVGPMLASSLAATMSSQSAVDNCDVGSEHLTVEYIMFEGRDATTHLNVTPKSKEERATHFKLDTILLSNAVNSEERDHLVEEVLAVGVGNILVKQRPEQARVLGKHLSKRHKHANSDKVHQPAQVVIPTPYPYMETKNSDTVLLFLRRQRLYLRRVASWMGHEKSFMLDLARLEDTEVEKVVREEAEAKVKAVCLIYGECIDHGDLLTVQMFGNAKLMMAGSTTAFGRLEFMGVMRLGLLHFKMKKLCLDIKAMMPTTINFDDEGCLAWLCSISDKTMISNNPKDIKKDDNSFEHHDQVKKHPSSLLERY